MVRFADAEPNGLADLVGRLIETNLKAHPDRRRLLRDTVVRLTASDAAIEATVTLSSAGVAVSNGPAGRRPHLVLAADAYDLIELAGAPLRFGFPDVFSGIPPIPAAPVQEPTHAQTRETFNLAKDSTVQIVGQACDHVQEGSGFIASDGYIVTNAHVVAGVDHPFVKTSTSSGSEEATVVLFDPVLDIAVLSSPNTAGPPLRLTTGTVERGDTGAILGYPQGGPLTGNRAAVLRTIEAVGHDIYGRGEPERLVLELQATVRPGNSGGPFVLTNGSVAGVVFAASTAQGDIGYAISSREFGPRLADAVGETQAVDTGPCIN